MKKMKGTIILFSLSLFITMIFYNTRNGVKDDDLITNLKYGPDSFKILSFNIRVTGLDIGRFTWINRRSKVVETLKKYNPDIISLQEDDDTQLQFLKEVFSNDYDLLYENIHYPNKFSNNAVFIRNQCLRQLIKVYFGYLKLPGSRVLHGDLS